MTQIVRWIAQTLAALKEPTQTDLPADVKIAIGDAKRINEVIVPPIQEYLLQRGYDATMVGCGWRVNTFCVVVTLSRPPKEEEILAIAGLAAPFPLAIEVAPDLRETCQDIIRGVRALGLKVEVLDVSTPLQGDAHRNIRSLPPSPAADSFDFKND